MGTNSISKVAAKQREWAFVQRNLTEFTDISNPCDFICVVLAQMRTVTIVGAELDRRPKRLPAGVMLPRALNGMDDTHRVLRSAETVRISATCLTVCCDVLRDIADGLLSPRFCRHAGTSADERSLRHRPPRALGASCFVGTLKAV